MILLLILFWVVILVAVVKYFNYKRLLLDRMSMNPDGFRLPIKEGKGYDALRFGLLFIGVGGGLLLGRFLLISGVFVKLYSESYDGSIPVPIPELAYLTGVFLCGGIMLVVGHLIESRAEKDKNSANIVRKEAPREEL